MEYITPEIEIIEFETEDVIGTSDTRGMRNMGEGDGDGVQNYPYVENIP